MLLSDRRIRLRNSTSVSMPWLLLILWWTLLLVSVVDSMDLAPIHWNNSNPMFKISNNDNIIDVNINDELDFVCPYNNSEFYIIYQVSRDEYKNCNLQVGGTRHLVVNCSTPKFGKRYTMLFERYSSMPNAQEFFKGLKYYFITTSTGLEDGLQHVHQGACLHNNMKLTIRVCCETTTTETLPTSTTTMTSTTTSRTTPTTRSRWKYPTNDKMPGNKHDGKKDEEEYDNHENEVLPNKEQLINGSGHQHPAMLLLCACQLILVVVAGVRCSTLR